MMEGDDLVEIVCPLQGLGDSNLYGPVMSEHENQASDGIPDQLVSQACLRGAPTSDFEQWSVLYT